MRFIMNDLNHRNVAPQCVTRFGDGPRDDGGSGIAQLKVNESMTHTHRELLDYILTVEGGPHITFTQRIGLSAAASDWGIQSSQNL